jgi:hypothetical protein
MFIAWVVAPCSILTAFRRAVLHPSSGLHKRLHTAKCMARQPISVHMQTTCSIQYNCAVPADCTYVHVIHSYHQRVPLYPCQLQLSLGRATFCDPDRKVGRCCINVMWGHCYVLSRSWTTIIPSHCCTVMSTDNDFWSFLYYCYRRCIVTKISSYRHTRKNPENLRPR